MTNNKINEILGFQIDPENSISETQKIFFTASEKIRDDILNRDIDDWLKEIVQSDYDEFMEIYRQVLFEKGDDMTLDDVRLLIPDNNVWLKIIDKIKKPAGGLDNDDMEKILEDLGLAKENNQIN